MQQPENRLNQITIVPQAPVLQPSQSSQHNMDYQQLKLELDNGAGKVSTPTSSVRQELVSPVRVMHHKDTDKFSYCNKTDIKQ